MIKNMYSSVSLIWELEQTVTIEPIKVVNEPYNNDYQIKTYMEHLVSSAALLVFQLKMISN